MINQEGSLLFLLGASGVLPPSPSSSSPIHPLLPVSLVLPPHQGLPATLGWCLGLTWLRIGLLRASLSPGESSMVFPFPPIFSSLLSSQPRASLFCVPPHPGTNHLKSFTFPATVTRSHGDFCDGKNAFWSSVLIPQNGLSVPGKGGLEILEQVAGHLIASRWIVPFSNQAQMAWT